ncbi:MAG: helix-hairpin-helix domain-containing protein [Pseudomonadota bacterium]
MQGMLAAKFDFTRLMPSSTESAFEYWMSMSPMAPVFGVRWRFADMMWGEADEVILPATATTARKPAKKVAAAAKPAPKAVPEKVEPVAKPAAKAPAPEPAAEMRSDDLTAIKGIGPKMAGALNAEGITNYSQIAAWSTEEAERLEAKIGSLPGRILRDDWIGQAKTLAQ